MQNAAVITTFNSNAKAITFQITNTGLFRTPFLNANNAMKGAESPESTSKLVPCTDI